VREGSKRINEIIGMGMNFDHIGNKLDLGIEGGHSHRRILHVGGDETGKKIAEFLIGKVKG